jgi:phosphoribosylanthranilate isomerase
MEKTALKICGIRSLEEIQDLKDLPIDYFGCIFAPRSPRCVSEALAKEITEIAHSEGKQTVGVFVNAPLEQIADTVNLTGIDVVQLHGEESPDICKMLTTKGITVWKAFSIKDKLLPMEDYLPYMDLPLLDTKGVAEGGNGLVFNWQLLERLTPYSFILAGGISVENVQKALSYQPVIIDVNSKVEQDNRKSRQLIEKLIKEMENYRSGIQKYNK